MVCATPQSARSARRVALTAVVCAAALGGAASAAAAASPWSVQRVPHPKVPVDSTLFDVSCRSSTWCVAVGGTFASSGQLFADRWNGHAWSLLHPPLPSRSSQSELASVSCTSKSACVAIGTFVRGGHVTPLAERWNGTRWNLSVVPKPPSAVDAELEGVSCVSARSCFAVGAWRDSGGDDQALAEQMRGSKWSLRLLSQRGKRSGVTALAGVSCTSSAVCTTVGYDDAGNGIALRWNASGWRFQFDSNPNLWAGSELYSVSCVSPTACAAAGGGNDSSSAGDVSNAGVAELWNGVKWTVKEDTDPTSAMNYDLFAVSCSARTACLAVGFIAERWNGQSWTLERIPAQIGLVGVSCPTRAVCIAVGNSTPRHGPAAPVAMRWSGPKGRNLAQPIHSTCRVLDSCPTPLLAQGRGVVRYTPRRQIAGAPGTDPRAPASSTRWH